MPLIMSSYATNLSFAGAGNAMAADEARLDLADSVTGGEFAADMLSLESQNKALSLDSANSWIQFQVAQGLQKRAKDMHNKDVAQQRRLMNEDGVIFF